MKSPSFALFILLVMSLILLPICTVGCRTGECSLESTLSIFRKILRPVDRTTPVNGDPQPRLCSSAS
jgi:hypothetical protein